MARVAIALYKGPPKDWKHWLSHISVKLWTWSKWSHAELVIDDICYSSSVRDNGVRAKQIDLSSGHWDVIYISLSEDRIKKALEWFEIHNGESYDWFNIIRWVLPFIPHHPSQRVCFEAVGDMLNLAGSHRLDADDLYQWALRNQDKESCNTMV